MIDHTIQSIFDPRIPIKIIRQNLNRPAWDSPERSEGRGVTSQSLVELRLERWNNTNSAVMTPSIALKEEKIKKWKQHDGLGSGNGPGP